MGKLLFILVSLGAMSLAQAKIEYTCSGKDSVGVSVIGKDSDLKGKGVLREGRVRSFSGKLKVKLSDKDWVQYPSTVSFATAIPDFPSYPMYSSEPVNPNYVSYFNPSYPRFPGRSSHPHSYPGYPSYPSHPHSYPGSPSYPNNPSYPSYPGSYSYALLPKAELMDFEGTLDDRGRIVSIKAKLKSKTIVYNKESDLQNPEVRFVYSVVAENRNAFFVASYCCKDQSNPICQDKSSAGGKVEKSRGGVN